MMSVAYSIFCALHILHVIVDVHRHPSPIYHLKFLISSLSEAKRSKRLFSKNRAKPRIIASITLLAIQGMTLQKQRKDLVLANNQKDFCK